MQPINSHIIHTTSILLELYQAISNFVLDLQVIPTSLIKEVGRNTSKDHLELVWPAIHHLHLDQLSSLEVQVVVDHVVMNQLLRSLFLSPYKEVHSLETVDLPS